MRVGGDAGDMGDAGGRRGGMGRRRGRTELTKLEVKPVGPITNVQIRKPADRISRKVSNLPHKKGPFHCRSQTIPWQSARSNAESTSHGTKKAPKGAYQQKTPGRGQENFQNVAAEDCSLVLASYRGPAREGGCEKGKGGEGEGERGQAHKNQEPTDP